jgi:hypothetical protein
MATPQLRPQLLLVKELYREAEQAAARDDKFSTSKGLLFFDLAVEQMLLTVITALPSKTPIPKGELKWDQLWQTASDIMTEHGHILPGKAALKNLHQDRNRVQHAGATFHFTQVRKYVGPVQNMLATTFQDAFGFDFENFREWDLIENEDLRRWLKESEDFLSEGNVEACIVGCILAHQWIVGAIRSQTKASRARGSLGYDLRGSVVEKAIQKVRKELIEDIQLLENEVVTIGVGLPVMDTRRFLQLTKITHVFIAVAGNIQVALTGDPRVKDSVTANYMLEYLVRLINLVEDGYPGVLNTIKVKIFPKEQQIWKKVKA